MKNIKIFLFIGLFANSMTAFGIDSLSQRVLQMKIYSQENYEELIYIQTDKQYYLAGEKIRFKVFCIEESTSKPSNLSKVAYFEALDLDNNPQLQARIELQDGKGHGEITVPTNINSGNYILRGYTRWMRNYGPETYFHSSMTIINPFKRLGLKPIPGADDISINFFPENGSIIDGVKTKIVFECKNSLGYPEDFVGKLLANDSILVKEFKPLKNGVGDFEFVPDMQYTYHVEAATLEGSTADYDFPEIVATGLSLQITEEQDSYVMNIFCNDISIVLPSAHLFYIIHQNGNVKAGDRFDLNEGKSKLALDKTTIEEGVFTISVFDDDGKILKQRQIINYSGDVEIPLLISSTSFGQREKVSVDLSNIIDQLSSEELDISVSAAARNAKFDDRNLSLSSYLLLKNSLSGVVYGLESFFRGTAFEVTRNINNLLIAYSATKDLSFYAEEAPLIEYIPEYRGQLVTGKVLNKFTKEPAQSIYTYLSVPGKNIQFSSTKSDRDGKFTFEVEDFYGTNEVIVQNNYIKDTLYSINMDDPFSQDYADIHLPTFDLDEQMENWIKRQSQNLQVENANIKFQPVLTPVTVVDSTSFYNEPDSKYILDDFTRFIVMEEVMREYVSGVNVRKNKEGFHFMVLDLQQNIIYNENPLMLLDGVPVFDADEIIALDPLKIEKIETVKTRFHKGFLDCRGIVSYTTYKGDLMGYTIHDNAWVDNYVGIQSKKQYLFPEYASSVQKRATTPDFRNVLYWNPEIKLSNIGNSTIEFYTSDDINDYEFRMEGIDENGNAFSKIIFFNVQPTNNN